MVLGSTAALAGFDSSAAHKALMEDHIKPIIEDTLIYDVESTTTGKLSGKAALITGSSSGIGKAVALAYAREGCDVVINYPPGNDADGANAREVAAEVELLGRKAFVAAADITVESEVATMVEQTLGEFGKIDILVNNAGIASASPVESMPPEMWDTMIKVNTRGMYLCTRAVLPHMYKRDSGRIINTASQLAYKGAPAFSHYCATKGAILSFTRSVALEIGTRRVRINAVGPGATMTPILAGVPDDVLNGIKAAIPRGKIAEVSEIAPTYVFLASDESDAYVGQCLSPNGGDAFL